MANTEKKTSTRPTSPPIYATAYWLYKSADFLYLESIGFHFEAIRKALQSQKFEDNNTLFVYSTSLLHKLKNLDKFPEVGGLIEKYAHIPEEKPKFHKAVEDIMRHIQPRGTHYGHTQEVVSAMIKQNIHPVLIIALTSKLLNPHYTLTEIDGFLLLKREYPYMKIPKTMALEYIVREG